MNATLDEFAALVGRILAQRWLALREAECGEDQGSDAAPREPPASGVNEPVNND